jgi:hypothetical protein
MRVKLMKIAALLENIPLRGERVDRATRFTSGHGTGEGLLSRLLCHGSRRAYNLPRGGADIVCSQLPFRFMGGAYIVVYVCDRGVALRLGAAGAGDPSPTRNILRAQSIADGK